MIAVATWEMRNYVIRKRTEDEERSKEEQENALEKRRGEIEESTKYNMNEQEVKTKVAIERNSLLMQLADIKTKKERGSIW